MPSGETATASTSLPGRSRTVPMRAQRREAADRRGGRLGAAPPGPAAPSPGGCGSSCFHGRQAGAGRQDDRQHDGCPGLDPGGGRARRRSSTARGTGRTSAGGRARVGRDGEPAQHGRRLTSAPGQALLHPLAGLGQPAGHGALRPAQLRGPPRLAPPFQAAQDERAAVLLGQAGQLLVEHRLELPPGQRPVGSARVPARPSACRSRRRRRAAVRRASSGDAAGDAVQPAGRPPPAADRTRPCGRGRGRWPGRRPRRPAGGRGRAGTPQHDRAVPAEQLRERRLVARATKRCSRSASLTSCVSWPARRRSRVLPGCAGHGFGPRGGSLHPC